MITWKIETRKISELKDYSKNPRKLSPQQAEHLKTSLQKFGLIDKPIINLDNTIIGGHQRKKTLKKLGIKEIEVNVPDRHLTEKEVEELNIRLNKNTGEWDFKTLEVDWQINDLLEWGFVVDEFPEIKEIEEGSEDPQDNLEPAKDEDAITKLGDVYELNNHRLICGDSTLPIYVEKCLNGSEPILLVTDPPYNLASENKIVASGSNNKMAKKLKDSSWDKNFDILPFLKNIENYLFKNISIYIFTSHHLAGLVWEWMKNNFDHISWCIWKKTNPMPSLMKRHWTGDSELICHATKGKHIFNFPLEGHAPSTFLFPKISTCDIHPTMKPIPVISHIINHSSNKKNVIFDPFLGSGTTLIAAEQLSRLCYGIELSPAYCDIIVARWKKFMEKNKKQFTIKRNGEIL